MLFLFWLLLCRSFQAAFFFINSQSTKKRRKRQTTSGYEQKGKKLVEKCKILFNFTVQTSDVIWRSGAKSVCVWVLLPTFYLLKLEKGRVDSTNFTLNVLYTGAWLPRTRPETIHLSSSQFGNREQENSKWMSYYLMRTTKQKKIGTSFYWVFGCTKIRWWQNWDNSFQDCERRAQKKKIRILNQTIFMSCTLKWDSFGI